MGPACRDQTSMLEKAASQKRQGDAHRQRQAQLHSAFQEAAAGRQLAHIVPADLLARAGVNRHPKVTLAHTLRICAGTQQHGLPQHRVSYCYHFRGPIPFVSLRGLFWGVKALRGQERRPSVDGSHTSPTIITFEGLSPTVPVCVGDSAGFGRRVSVDGSHPSLNNSSHSSHSDIAGFEAPQW